MARVSASHVCNQGTGARLAKRGEVREGPSWPAQAERPNTKRDPHVQVRTLNTPYTLVKTPGRFTDQVCRSGGFPKRSEET